MAKKALLLGVDFGTGGCKITVIDDSGYIKAEATREYPTYHPEQNSSEQNPEDWFEAFKQSLKEVSESGKVNLNDLQGISLDASTHNVVLLDKSNKIIRPTIMWTDQRSIKEVAYLEENYGEKIFDVCFQKVAPTWTLPQLLWIKNNEPENYKKIKKIMFIKDYIRFLLTGSWETDYIDAQGTLFFDMRKMKWSEELCAIIDLDLNVLPPLCNPFDVVGEISEEASKITGLPSGIPVICGSSDSAVEDYGAGAIEPGQCILKLATAGNVNVMTEKPYPSLFTLTYSHIVPDMWYTVAATNTAASSMRWFRDVFCERETGVSRNKKINIYSLAEEMVALIPAGSEGLIYHPYLLGERSPYWDPFLRSSFTGATMNHRKPHFLRALMEGVAFSLKDCYRVIEDMKLKVKEFIIIGGGSRSNVWCQIVSDVFSHDIIKPSVSDASYGAAIIAGVGIGLFSDLKEAVKKCNRIEKVYRPNKENSNIYKKLFKIYLEIHDRLKDIYRNLNNILRSS